MITAVVVFGAVVLLVLTLQDVFEVMLLPRRVMRRLRFVSIFYRVTWRAWSWLATLLTRNGRREHLLGVYGALSMVLLFGIWTVGLILGFGLLLWAAHVDAGTTSRSTLGDHLYMSGVTFFTVGYGDLVPQTRLGRLISVLEAGTGLGFIALVIGYLPVLYQLFSRREAHVIKLDGRAGSPPTAIALLQRHSSDDGIAQIGMLLRDWEIWGSELLESHLSYPMLAYYRSQHHDQSWLAALTAIMDCCALILVGLDHLPPLQARMTFTMARQVLVEMTQSFGVPPSRYTGGDRLNHAAFLQLDRQLDEAGFNWNTPDAEELLAALRATYEPLLDGLASYLLLPLQGWSAGDTARDHWVRGPRGTLARRLVDELSEAVTADESAERAIEKDTRWRRLRSRLKLGRRD
jgi:voltage-gated potassium channel Kch